MTKTELIEVIAEKAGIAKKDADKAVTAFMETVSETLQKGDKLQLIGFGTFGVSERAERTGRNPRTGEPVKIPATKLPSFKPGSELKAAVK